MHTIFDQVGAVEALHFRKTGHPVDLSVQNVLDCGFDFYGFGCEGGFPSLAYDFIKDNGGIDSEASYPYRAEDPPIEGYCQFRKPAAAKVSGYAAIKSGSEDDLTAAVASAGPASVAMNFGDLAFYHSGVYNNTDCPRERKDLHHAMLVVGYGPGYYVVKNSFGEDWGERGYLRVARNGQNICGIATRAAYPLG